MKQKIIFFMFIALIIFSLISNVRALSCVDVYGLTVYENTASAYVINNADTNETIYYKLFVDGSIVNESQTVLGPHETKYLTLKYNFGIGEYDVAFRVVAGCGEDEDSLIHLVSQPYSCRNPYGIEGQVICNYNVRQYMICRNGEWACNNNQINYCSYCNAHCGDEICNCDENDITCQEDCPAENYDDYSEGCNSYSCATCISEYLDSYRCNGKWLQKLYKNEDCSKTWLDWEYCEFGCSDKKCNPVCDVSIKEFEYRDNLLSQQEGNARVVVENTGEEREILELEFFIDGIKKGFYAKSVGDGEKLEKIFNYRLNSGKHRISIIVTSRCGKSTARSAYINVFSKQNESTQEVQKPKPKETPKKTDVQVFPTNLDISLEESKVVAIDIETENPQEFKLEVEGIPSDWVSYVKKKYIENSDFMYIYITPRDYGTYHFRVKVAAERENKTFESNVKFYVAPENVVKSGFFGNIVSEIWIVFTSFWTLMIVVVTVLVFVLLMGIYNLKYEGV